MQKSKRRILIYSVIAIAVVAIVVMALIPDPVIVDAATVERGPMRVTVNEKGETRAKDRFTVTAPVAGELRRIELREGMEVGQGDVIAQIEPLPLDARQRQELTARADAAASALSEARSLADRAQSTLALAQSERRRIESLAREEIASDEALERARTSEQTARNELEAARSRVRTAQAELEAARSGLLAVEPGRSNRIVEVRAPVEGEILRIPERSARVVQAGEPLIQLSDSHEIEIVVEMLSTEAVKVSSGDLVIIDEWGGDEPLRGTVRLVEPSGFRKISALGIEEQRVNVVVDLAEAPPALGDGYRVEARVVIWSGQDVVHVPISALFRKAETWAVFVVEDGKAVAREVGIGHQNDVQAEVLSGLDPGETVILHPSNDLADGVRVEVRSRG